MNYSLPNHRLETTSIVQEENQKDKPFNSSPLTFHQKLFSPEDKKITHNIAHINDSQTTSFSGGLLKSIFQKYLKP